MPRATLAALLDDTAPDSAASTGPGEQASPHRSEEDGAEARSLHPVDTATTAPAGAPDRADARSGNPVTAPAPAAPGEPTRPGTPRYLQLERKELRVRLDQADELSRLTRRLNRARGGTGERITDNTLIRVAIDLLLQRSDQLAGNTEDALRDSVSQ